MRAASGFSLAGGWVNNNARRALVFGGAEWRSESAEADAHAFIEGRMNIHGGVNYNSQWVEDESVQEITSTAISTSTATSHGSKG